MKSYERKSERVLEQVVHFLFENHPFESQTELAAEAGLCLKTVYNLYHRDTKQPRFRTIAKLCMASGIAWRVATNGDVICRHFKLRRIHSQLAKAM